ncbi:hypothetical protein lerEdw1_005693, partial [Lerista edwardsae]
MDYIIEWERIPRKPGSDICWHYQPGTANHMVITEAIEPGYLYGLKVFGLIDGNVWALGSTTAYSKQIATVVLDSSTYRYLIEGLAPGSIIRVSITVTNEGGSTKGPTLSIRTKDYGEEKEGSMLGFG